MGDVPGVPGGVGRGCADGAVAQEGGRVDARGEPGVRGLQLPCVCECQEGELADGAAV